MDQLIAFYGIFGSCVLRPPQKDYFLAVPWRGSFGRILTMQLEPPKKGEFFLPSSWLQHLFKISYNIPNIGKKALHQGSRQVLLSHKRHLQLPLRSLASLGQLWLGRGLEWACQFMCAQPSPSNWPNTVQYAKRNARYDQETLSGASTNLL